MKTKRKSSWEWYAIKQLFESTISGEPNKDIVDEKFSDDFKLYEERIIVVKAQSSDHAYKIADKFGKQDEMTYSNPYDQIVEWKYIDSLNCQQLFDDEIKSGTEIYSRLIKVPVNDKTENVIKTFCPETVD